MTNETKKRIEAYKSALPEMKERLVGAAFLMVMSIIMMASASFAWLTLSRAPEATGMQTTVAANGNLEIALAQGSTKNAAVAPTESQVGDSSAAEGQNITKANVTWGNLVNVSDPIYGLGNIELRPALLSAYNRLDYPLNGATYGGDGRVVTTNERYEFASYGLVDGTTDQYYFAAGDKVNYGVRAISSVGYTNLSGNLRIDNYRNDTNQLYMNVQNYYSQIVASEPNSVNTLDKAEGVTCISALEGLVTVFAQDKVNGFLGNETKTSCSPYLWYLYQMLLLLQNTLDYEGKAILEMANWQAYVASGDNKTENTFPSIDVLLTATEAELKSKGVTVSTLVSYKKSVSDLEYCIKNLKPMAEKCKNPDAPEKVYYWNDISTYVNRLVDINSTTLNGVALQEIGKSNIMSVVGGGDVIIYKGALVDLEKRLVNDQNRVQAKVQVKVKVSGIPYTIKGTVYTDAYGKDSAYSVDLAYSDGLQSGAKGDASAKDTYGLALDLWVRSNYPGAVLTLEGSAKYEEERATAVIEGKTYELYTITVGEGEAKTEVDVYKKTADSGDAWYYVSTLDQVPESDLGSQTPKEKYISVVSGYEGENRVWEDWRELLELGYIEQDATTQGAGSCFVFYANTPTEQVKIMEMLEAFNVAFMDQNGNILGTAKLNLDSAYANQGKVTVPLEVETGTEYTDESGVSHKGITRLTQNTPTMITAIVYLNGSKLQNENVLADAELQGQLNIQFGTDSVLVAPDNEELQAQARSITAEVIVKDSKGQEVGRTKDGTIGGTEGLLYNAEGYTATVELTVEGEQPERISGFFVRVINSTQGTRGEEVNFARSENGKWTAEFSLKNPGKYAFNTLIVDGVQYTLHDGSEQSGMNTYYESNRPYVYIQGLKITSASVGVAPGTYMTADSSMNFPVSVTIDAAVTPKQVNAQFFSLDNKKQYTAILSYDSVNNQWVGSADIKSSDTYKLKYITVDGISIEAPELGNYELYLGLTARVSTTLAEEAWSFNYTGPSQITMTARIFDDNGNPIDNLSDVKLVYNNVASPAPLTWDNAGYYKGVFEILQPGELTFKRLELGTLGVIYNVSTSPTFWAISLEKPIYKSASAGTQQTVIKDSLDAKIRVEMEHAETAAIYAVAEHKLDDKTTTYYIAATTDSGNTRTFILPRLDGEWTLKQLWLQNIYDPDYEDANGNKVGKWYSKTASGLTETLRYTTEPLEGDFFVLDTDIVTTEVVANCYVTVTYDGQEKQEPFTEKFGGSEAEFMNSYHSKKLAVKVCDYKGRAIDGVKSVKWDIVHEQNTMESYGGYTGTGVSTNTVTLGLQEGSKTVYEASEQEFHVAGKYTSKIVVDLDTNGKKELTAVPAFEVRSKAPTLTISGITPTGSNPTKITWTTAYWGTIPTFTAVEEKTSSINGNTATVYAVATADNSTLDHHGNFTKPTLTLTVAGVNEECTVNVTLPGGSVQEVIFQRKGSGTMSRDLGSVSEIKRWVGGTLNAYNGHETQQISSMKITYDNVEYTVKLDSPITIINPSSVNQL